MLYSGRFPMQSLRPDRSDGADGAEGHFIEDIGTGDAAGEALETADGFKTFGLRQQPMAAINPLIPVIPGNKPTKLERRTGP